MSLLCYHFTSYSMIWYCILINFHRIQRKQFDLFQMCGHGTNLKLEYEIVNMKVSINGHCSTGNKKHKSWTLLFIPIHTHSPPSNNHARCLRCPANLSERCINIKTNKPSQSSMLNANHRFLHTGWHVHSLRRSYTSAKYSNMYPDRCLNIDGEQLHWLHLWPDIRAPPPARSFPACDVRGNAAGYL